MGPRLLCTRKKGKKGLVAVQQPVMPKKSSHDMRSRISAGRYEHDCRICVTATHPRSTLFMSMLLWRVGVGFNLAFVVARPHIDGPRAGGALI